MIPKFNDWVQFQEDTVAGSATTAGTGNVLATGDASPSSTPSGGGTDTSDIAHNRFGVGYGFWPFYIARSKKATKKCKNGRRKDGQCRKKKK